MNTLALEIEKAKELRKFLNEELKQEEDLLLTESFRNKQSEILRDVFAPPESFDTLKRCEFAVNSSSLVKAGSSNQQVLRFNNTRDALASNYLPTLLHWFFAALESAWSTQKQPYSWFLPDEHQNTEAPDFPARIDLATGEYVSSPTQEHKFSKDESKTYTIGIVSDWASGTQDSYEVARHMWQQRNLYNVHLGDTYFTGTKTDCLENFCGKFKGSNNNKIPVQFPWGEQGALAIPGNHEQYSHSTGFRQVIMPFCGANRASEQQAPFWSLETAYWIVIGLDTAYNCFDLLKWNSYNNTEAANPDMLLADPIVKWLQANFASNPQDKRGIILLTHHMPMSVIDQEPVFQNMMDQLATLFNTRTIVHLWGHEHFFMAWRPATWTTSNKINHLRFHGRCIGIGGFPVNSQSGELASGFHKYAKYVQCADMTPGIDSRYGRNGFCRLALRGNRAHLEYYMLKYLNSDESVAVQVAAEEFRIELDSGILHASGIRFANDSAADNTFLTSESLVSYNKEFIPALQRQTKDQSSCVGCWLCNLM